MIRHGQASFGQENYDQLSELGVVQARALAEYYSDIGVCFDACYTGTMQRHLDSAEQFFQKYSDKKIPCPALNSMEAFNEYDPEAVLKALIPVLVEEDPLFSEDVEKMFSSKKSFQKVFERAIMKWVSDDFQLPGLISWERYSASVKDGIKDVMKVHGTGKKIAMFTSGGPISAVIQQTLSLSNTATIQVGWQIINSSVTRFKFTQDRIMMMSFNEHAHLEMKMEGALVTYR
jgi:broad specificity phosphatase PhoE